MELYVIREKSTGKLVEGGKGQYTFNSISGAKNSFNNSTEYYNTKRKLLLATSNLANSEEYGRIRRIWDNNNYNDFVAIVGEEGLRRFQELNQIISTIERNLPADQRKFIEKSSRFNDSNYSIERVVDFVTEPVITK